MRQAKRVSNRQQLRACCLLTKIVLLFLDVGQRRTTKGRKSLTAWITEAQRWLKLETGTPVRAQSNVPFLVSLVVSLNLLDLHVAIDRLCARVLIPRLIIFLVDRRLHSLYHPPLEFGHFISRSIFFASIHDFYDYTSYRICSCAYLAIYSMDLQLALSQVAWYQYTNPNKPHASLRHRAATTLTHSTSNT